MALTDILEKIKEEAEKKIAELKKEFEDKKKKVEDEFSARQKKIDEEIHGKVEEKSKKIMEKAENLAEMETKNALLKGKREIIEEAFEKAIKELTTSDQYTDVVTQMLKKAELEGDDVVIVPARGKEKETKDAIQGSGKKYFLSDKSADITGGFILKTATVEIDNSFETIVKKQLRDDLEIIVNKLLFA